MFLTTQLRTLRLRHGISLIELERKTGISNQHLSRLELGRVHATPQLEQRVTKAVGELIADRKSALLKLEGDYLLQKGRLLVPTEAQEDES